MSWWVFPVLIIVAAFASTFGAVEALTNNPGAALKFAFVTADFLVLLSYVGWHIVSKLEKIG